MKKFTLFALALLTSQMLLADGIGVVDFKAVLEKSKIGKAEQTAFANLRDQMTGIVEKTEKDLEDVVKKLEDADYMDGLSDDAQQELQKKFQTLSQEMGRYQGQYYQILNQAQMRLLQELQTKVSESAKVIAEKQKLSLVLDEEACFYFNEKLEITDAVIKELDTRFDKESAEKDANKSTAK